MYSRLPFGFLILTPGGTPLPLDGVASLASPLEPRLGSPLRELRMERRDSSSVSSGGGMILKPASLLRAAAVFLAAPAKIFDVTRSKSDCAVLEASSTRSPSKSM